MASLKDIGPIVLDFTVTGTTTNTRPAPKRDSLAAAREHVDALMTANQVLFERLRAVRTLFGPSVYHALEQDAERVVEHGMDAATEFERVVSAMVINSDDLIAAHQRKVDALLLEMADADDINGKRVDRLTMLLRFAVDDVTDRYKRSKRPEPAWLADARASVEPVL